MYVHTYYTTYKNGGGGGGFVTLCTVCVRPDHPYPSVDGGNIFIRHFEVENAYNTIIRHGTDASNVDNNHFATALWSNRPLDNLCIEHQRRTICLQPVLLWLRVYLMPLNCTCRNITVLFFQVKLEIIIPLSLIDPEISNNTRHAIYKTISQFQQYYIFFLIREIDSIDGNNIAKRQYYQFVSAPEQ